MGIAAAEEHSSIAFFCSSVRFLTFQKTKWEFLAWENGRLDPRTCLGSYSLEFAISIPSGEAGDLDNTNAIFLPMDSDEQT